MKIVLGVTGGVAVYKMLGVVRQLQSDGHEIVVIMTPAAAKFVNPILFKTLSHNTVLTEDFDISRPIAHVELADWADVYAVAPATANTIAKIAHGIADNLLTTTALARTGRRIVFPSMNVHMYENPATQENLCILSEKLGWEVVEPDSGSLACGYSGKGRLVSEERIAAVISRDPDAPLKGKKYIVTAGGTIEKIDPVRYISNFSSGKMGIETAKALYKKGADVLLVYGNITASVPSYIESVKIESAAELLDTLRRRLPLFDGVFMAAAVADYAPSKQSQSKIKRHDDKITLELTANPDVLKTAASENKGKLFVGFALETDDAEANAAKKLSAKGIDYIVLNRLGPEHNPLGADENSVRLIGKNGAAEESGLISKKEAAEWLVRRILIENPARGAV
ncbi:MAG: hypothetical protein A2Y33_10875 [Spirochaetes bacterium GWF1_51_8]|nr:MAG: hypothetical protein A2Y33_10875 [Spirochaetes bacterium GWF1_51_8]